MKTAATIFLLLIIMMQTFNSFLFDAAYALNKNYIADKLCVNKDKPLMHCNGHCYLAKQQQKEQNSDKQSTESRHEKFEVTAYYLSEHSDINFERFTIQKFYFDHIDISLPEYSSSIFHPPLI